MTKLKLVEILEEKIQAQGGVPTFFDKFISARVLKNTWNFPNDIIENLKAFFDQSLRSNSNRFSEYEERLEEICPYSKTKSTHDPITFSMSQGTHSTIKWRDLDVFKATSDLAIYMQLISELRPATIVEYGSGSGGSAVWLADIASLLNNNISVLSFDINKPCVKHKGVTFEEVDLIETQPELDFKKGKKLIIEDAHINVTEVLLSADSFLSKGDYLIVEDSAEKVKDIAYFLDKAQNKYLVDNYYVDFFGRNCCSAVDSIFIVD